MKQLSRVTMCFFVMFLIASGCKKGDQGPAGPQGEQGAAGQQGVQGPAGSRIYSGNGPAAANLGVAGDFYLDVATTNFYGPKTANGWGTPVSLMGATGAPGATGATGATGAAGSKIISGNGLPNPSIGNDGDYYIDKATYSLFGPKTAGAWDVGFSLRGPAGPQGATGATGATGAQGPAGTANVIYSAWKYAVGFNDSLIDNSSVRVAYVPAPSLSTSILNSGTVIVYFSYGGGNFVLPYTSNAGGRVNTIAYVPMLNKILITRFAHDNSNLVNLSTILQYRYIIIPGGVSGRQTGLPDYNDYAAVCKYYNLPQ